MGKWFPKLYDSLMSPLERRGIQNVRINLIQKAQGKVLEIGSGTGLNFPFYLQAEQVVAIEPEPLMRKQSLLRANKSRVPIEVILAGAEELPFLDNSFDTVVGTLVLCTIPDPQKALEEIRRVCKPNGQILLFEHVKVNHPVLGRIQDWMTPVWQRLCDGCHLNRNTLEIVKHTGFHVRHIERHFKNIFVVIEAVNRK
ncbi:class I SAM-dependent methyltransferase [Brevibacillus agri]|uniref:class I SAM-dependent methyltransferase n=1 Tax=Brevibacillus TaxID=55080 RepID=UPI00203E08E3|nr:MULTISPECIES: class I SAM-dependent methyltransferase [Brevibacillus]MCM3431712.1 class I SAM-dependent methyltransferase [Brevibacillus invocatus]MED1645882.1 class I SAM-dependent methyltransferase [Brevibacillus agri]MED1657579.1 class I SAM-dependent methyltransferase [Brevibacillus agri]MED1690071.1 class I SAM-dependent methyltransferase [Brevibacillus agri]MED1694012.1 class I SAM-dependent methyltransferase [Brevibacillus agri]